MKNYEHEVGDYPSIEYDVAFEIKGETSLETLVRENSKLELLKSKPPISSNALRYRVQEDVENIKKTLKNKGYFDADVDADIDINQEAKLVKVTIETGVRYTIGGLRIEVSDHDPEMQLSPSKLSRVIEMDVGQDVDQERLFEANLRLERYFKNHGYPFVKMEIPEGQLNKDKKILSVCFKAGLNTKRRFGDTIISGDKRISREYVKNRIVWRKGEIYDEREVDRTKRELISTEIFSSVNITPIDDGSGETAIKVDLIEGPPRSIGAGAQYTTSEGVGGKVRWQHRNLLGGGEVLSVDAKGNRKESKATLTYKTPDIFIPDLDLLTRLQAAYNNTDAYKGQVYEVFLGVEYWYQELIRAALGVDYERSKLTKTLTQREKYFSIPASVLIDARNDVINPYKGWRLLVEGAPYFGSLGQSDRMFRLLINGSYYLRLVKKDKVVIGFWGRVGKISHINNADIPYDKRFYAGGLNSVRGYGYQKLGPIDAMRNPAGGQTLVEFGMEPRVKVTDKIGAVVFVEAGAVGQASQMSEQSSSYLVGYGIGARYYTDIGPIRLDLAFPAKKRSFQGKRYDAPFQLYISIGQAF